MKRRIEITREHWKRIRISTGNAPASCPHTTSVQDRVPLAEAARSFAISIEQLDCAVRDRLLMAWKTNSGEVVCPHCIRDLFSAK